MWDLQPTPGGTITRLEDITLGAKETATLRVDSIDLRFSYKSAGSLPFTSLCLGIQPWDMVFPFVVLRIGPGLVQCFSWANTPISFASVLPAELLKHNPGN